MRSRRWRSRGESTAGGASGPELRRGGLSEATRPPVYTANRLLYASGMVKEEIRRYLAALGKKGGAAGTGKAKRRGPAHYQRITKLAAEARKKAATARKAKKKRGR